MNQSEVSGSGGLEKRAEQPAQLRVAGARLVEKGAALAGLAGEGVVADA